MQGSASRAHTHLRTTCSFLQVSPADDLAQPEAKKRAKNKTSPSTRTVHEHVYFAIYIYIRKKNTVYKKCIRRGEAERGATGVLDTHTCAERHRHITPGTGARDRKPVAGEKQALLAGKKYRHTHKFVYIYTKNPARVLSQCGCCAATVAMRTFWA